MSNELHVSGTVAGGAKFILNMSRARAWAPLTAYRDFQSTSGAVSPRLDAVRHQRCSAAVEPSDSNGHYTISMTSQSLHLQRSNGSKKCYNVPVSSAHTRLGPCPTFSACSPQTETRHCTAATFPATTCNYSRPTVSLSPRTHELRGGRDAWDKRGHIAVSAPASRKASTRSSAQKPQADPQACEPLRHGTGWKRL